MKKTRLLFLLLLFTFIFSGKAYAKVGDIGFFGGTTDGRKLPKTTELIIAEANGDTVTATDTFIYKEILVLDGIPTEFEGNLTIRDNVDLTDLTEMNGTGTVTYTITPANTAAANGASLARTITFDVTWRREGSQIIMDYDVANWTETVTTGGGTFTIDPSRSSFSVSIIEDQTPGVNYSKGNLSMTAVYTTGGGAAGEAATAAATVQSTGSIYSFDTAWSATETHRIDTWVYAPTWQMQYQIRPSIAVNKTLQYTQNEPTAISFRGNYMEVIQNKSSISYDIFVKPLQAYDIPDKGSASIPSYNSFEQLIAPDTSFLQGHFAEADINRLFSMQVLTGSPRNYRPDQAITRGQYVEALVRAVKLPIDLAEANQSTRSRRIVNVVFPDVMPEREEYPYIMAAYRAGLAIGRDNGNFYIDSPIERQEAIVIMVRTLGLSNLGLDPTPVTPFTDDAQIAGWAKKEFYAAQRIGVISGDANGNIRPTDYISKAEGAALVNRMIDYMRYDLVTDYTEHIVNYAY